MLLDLSSLPALVVCKVRLCLGDSAKVACHLSCLLSEAASATFNLTDVTLRTRLR